jgi:hypothetical protein
MNMRRGSTAALVALGGLVVVGSLGPIAVRALGTTQNKDRFEFQVVESFDAKYLGDTPGHRGRGGGLGNVRPDIALGDPVFHDDQKVGKVSSLLWDRTKESLEVEFDPEPFVRVTVGESVWIPFGGKAPKAGASR